jgi:hypothetical protein
VALDLRDFDYQYSNVVPTYDQELSDGFKGFLEKIAEERAKVIYRAMNELITKSSHEYTAQQLRTLYFVDGREYIVAPNGIGYRIGMDWGTEENDYTVACTATPVIMSKEISNEGS